MSIFNHYINNKAHFLWALLFITVISNAQNLVPNYSFELNSNCGSAGGGGS